jgi:signal transduction histidine kinase
MAEQKDARQAVKSRTIITSDLPFLADWFVISLRWLCLLGFTVTLSLSHTLNTLQGFLLLSVALWNLLMSLFAILNTRLTAHRIINTIIDLVISFLLFQMTGGLGGPLNWAGLLPLFTAAIYYEYIGSILIAIILCIGQIGWLYLNPPFPSDLRLLGILAGFILGAGLLLGLISRPLQRRLRRNYQGQVRQRLETVQRVQFQERDRMQAIFRMIETLSATLNYELVLNTSLDLSLSALSETGQISPYLQQTVCAVLLFKEHDLFVASSRRFPPPDLRQTFPAEKGVLHEVIQTAEPKVMQDPFSDPELHNLLSVRDCRSALVLPLRRGLDGFGAMFFAHPDTGFFTKERAELLEVISHQVIISIQNARLYEEKEQEKQAMMETEEEARRKLARNLHDGPTQSVAAIAMRANIVRRIIRSDPELAEAEIGKIEDMARRTTQEIRHMLFTLRPLILETEGLDAALRLMAEKMQDTFQQNVSISVDPELLEKLETNKQTVIFFLVEEALTNARKHANASQIGVQLVFTRDRNIALLEVADDGVGFDVAAINAAYEKRGSLGMVNLRERAQLINGLLHIDSSPGKGTRVQIFIPLNEEALDRLQRGLVG